MKGIPFKQWEVQAHNEGRKSSFVRVIKPANPFKGNKLEYCQGDGLWVSDDTDNGDKEGHIKDYSVSSCWISWSRYTDKYAPCQVGDILYIKETFRYVSIGEEDHEGECLWEEDVIEFKASQEEFQKEYGDYVGDRDKWQPSIHMPEEAARSFIRITGVKVLRVKDITREDAIKVGLTKLFDYLSKEEYEDWAKRTGETRTQDEWRYTNYLWHGHFGECGTGNKMSDTWKYQCSAYDSAKDSFSSLWERDNFKQRDKIGWDANPWVWVFEYERVNKEDAYVLHKE